VAGTNVSISGSWPNQTISSTAASGDVVGPASATDNALARFDTTTGELIQNSVAILDDSGNLTGIANLTVNDNTILGSSNSDTVTVTARVNSDIDPSTDNTYDLGRNSHAWRNLYLTGTANIAALSASGAVTLSGGTANGVAYLNGSKVLTTGSALTFDGTNLGIGTSSPKSDVGLSLHLFNSASTGTVASNAYLLVESSTRNAVIELSGSATSTNGLNFSDTPGTALAGIASTTADQNLLFRTGGTTERMRIDSSGNVGIGTSSPGDKLDVAGSGRFTVDVGGTSTPLKLINNSTTGTVVAKLAFENGGSVKASINAAVYNNDFLTFNTGSDTERARIDSSGNLGLGVTSPGDKLEIGGAGAGIILASPNGTRYRITVSDLGVLTVAAV
jgi:hypothetical protein